MADDSQPANSTDGPSEIGAPHGGDSGADDSCAGATGDHANTEEVFHQLLDLPESKRAEYLDRVCGVDPERRRRIEELLVADRQACQIEDEESQRHGDARARVGTTIGRYKIVDIIATGGMSVVYEALQEEPRRLVAIKMLRQGLPSARVAERFSREAQLLGALHHRNIAEIYEANTDSSHGIDTPYLAIERLVAARDILDFAAVNELTCEERILLFLEACEAVEHGHRQGVIHRDLKPSNILVDGDGVLKVIDFGIARMLEEESAAEESEEGSPPTLPLGTPRYMSPEQFISRSHQLDTRTDVYSLGVVLYQLLTGTLPHDDESSSHYQLSRAIVEDDAPAPSSIDQTLAGDLETIIVTALARDRERRYRSVAALADDLKRYLDQRPIEARPAGIVHRLALASRRHRWRAAALALVAVSTLVSAVVVAVAFTSRGVALEEALAEGYAANLAAVDGALARFDHQEARNLLGEAKQLAANSATLTYGWEADHAEARMATGIEWLIDDERRPILTAPAPSERGGLWRLREGSIEGYEASDYGNTADAEPILLGEARLDPGVQRAALSSDGRLLATAEMTGDGRWQVAVHTLEVTGSVAIPETFPPRSPGTAKAGDPRLPPTFEIRGEQGQPGDVRALAIDSRNNGGTVAVATSDGIELWSDSGGDWKKAKLLDAGNQDIVDLIFNPDGSHLASASDKDVRIWDVAIGACSAILLGHEYHVLDVAFSASGELLASCGSDGTVRIWDVAAKIDGAREKGVDDHPGRLLATLRGHRGTVHSVAFHPQAPLIASGGGDHSVRLWWYRWQESSDELLRFQVREVATYGGHRLAVEEVAFDPGGNTLISTDKPGAVFLWPAYPAADHVVFDQRTSSLRLARFIGSGSGASEETIVSICGNGELKRWDATSGQGIETVRNWENGHECSAADFDGDSGVLALAFPFSTDQEGNRGAVELWKIDPDRGRVPLHKKTLEASQPLVAVAISPGGRRLAAASEDGAVLSWQIDGTASGATAPVQLEDLADGGKKTPLRQLLYVDDQHLLVAGASDNSRDASGFLRLIDASSGEMIASLPGDRGYLSVAVDLQSKRIAAGGSDGTIVVASSTLGNVEEIVQPLAKGITALAFHPDGSRLLAGSLDSTVTLFRSSDWQVLSTIGGHLGSVTDLAFDGSGMRLLTALAGDHAAGNHIHLRETEAIAHDIQLERAKREFARVQAREFLLPHWKRGTDDQKFLVEKLQKFLVKKLNSSGLPDDVKVEGERYIEFQWGDD